MSQSPSESQSHARPTPAFAKPLDDADVRHVAKLARLAIPDDQVHRYALQLQDILRYVAKIAEVNIQGVEPTAHAAHIHSVFREDVVGPMLTLAEVLQNAPDAEPPFFKVPKVVGAEEDSAG